MDVSTYIRPNTKNFIEGYDLLRTFLSETKSRFASDSIEDICYDGIVTLVITCIRRGHHFGIQGGNSLEILVDF